MKNSSFNSNICFGKISWGSPETAKKTAIALETLKEANDIDGKSLLKFNDVFEQLQLLSNHPDTFKVACSLDEGYHSLNFLVNVFENESRELLVSTSECISADYIKKETSLPIKNDIKSLAKNVFNKHKSISIKAEVEALMKKLGKIN